jgi:hypothetical protein
MTNPIHIEITANAVPATDFQRLADKLYAVLATEANTIKVFVTATVTKPTEITFQPNNKGARKYSDAVSRADRGTL